MSSEHHDPFLDLVGVFFARVELFENASFPLPEADQQHTHICIFTKEKYSQKIWNSGAFEIRKKAI